MAFHGRQIVWIVCSAALLAGCTRNHYRLAADFQTYGILAEKTAHTPWEPPAGYSVYPDPRSRFYNPTNPNDPALPIPAPKLYAYELPELPERDPDRFEGTRREDDEAPEQLPCPPGVPEPIAPLDGPVEREASSRARKLPDAAQTAPDATSVQFAFHTEIDCRTSVRPAAHYQDETLAPGSADILGSEIRVAPIPEDVWESLPEGCLRRMFEFESVREEFELTFGEEPAAEERDAARRLALEDIVELALINSREYQTQKEFLYRAALALTLERYEFELKFTPFGVGSDVTYIHNRTFGQTVNTLSIPTRATVEKTLATGGDFLASFANDVLLTFNGPNGFDADISSELLFAFSQNVFQRDILLEDLTLAERNVVYAAREFIRFRKVFFRNLAAQYYQLLLAFRSIEISAQDYFSNLRGFNQAAAEYRAGRVPRFQVDQFEQNALASRSRLIARCNALESALDSLKLIIGIPPETPINLDLTELENLTLRDEATVAAELVRRARRNLLQERGRAAPDRITLLNSAIDLTRRMLNLAALRERLGEEQTNQEELELLLARLLVEEAQLLVRLNRDLLAEERMAMPEAPPLRIFQRTMDLVNSLLLLVGRQLELAEQQSKEGEIAEARQVAAQLRQRQEAIRAELEAVIERRELDRIPQLVLQAEQLLAEADILATQTLPQEAPIDPAEQQAQILSQIDDLLAASQQMLGDSAAGLTPVEIDMDEAMLTALTQRFDLMNQRGALADAWRAIKFAADDLKSILNLNATQIIRTPPDANQPFNFTFDESQTRLSLSFDAPLNRRAQRNAFRIALINYNAALRALIEAEDAIKFDVREDLRDLQLDREQYRIAVASAALAYERVLSTRLQLQLGVEGVAARDFLEAQQAYTASLSDVASEHIGYILDRIDLFLDLELLYVTPEGFWPELYDEELQPEPVLHWPSYGYHPYGYLPDRIIPSHKIRRMLHVPPGVPTVFDPGLDADDEHAGHTEQAGDAGLSAPPPEELPEPPDPPPAPPEIIPGPPDP